MTDYIKRADAIDAVAEEWLSEASAESPYVNDNDIDRYRELAEELFADIPSADAVEVDRTSEWVAVRREEYEDLIADAEQVTGKLQNPCDSLLTDDKAECKEQKSKLDLISRADVLKYPIRLDHYDEVNGSREFVYGVESVIEYVESLPSADAVHGEWLPIGETLPTYDGGEKTWLTGMKCSNCGKLFDLRVGYYFCPNCGARMKGGAK